MKTLLTLVLAIAGTSLTLAAQDDCDGPGAKCNQHMCPVACSATTEGYQAVARLPLVHVEAGEFLA